MADESNPFLDMFTRFGQDLKIPGPDITAMMDIHRKNLAALQSATQIGTSSAQAIMEKQRDALETTLADIADTVKEASGTGDAGSMALAPVEVAKRSFDATLKNASEISGIVQKGNLDAFKVLKDRVIESVHEMTGTTPDQAANKNSG
ncbi:MAG: TIGR01841 family phasin [Rhodobacteraceae bacterium]|nr:TIGR01841 family phasin [Paracoccaceae bacterium]